MGVYLTLENVLKQLTFCTSIILLWRSFVFDLVWLIPRQPVTGLYVTVVFHRIACLHIPQELYQVFSPLFDGDATPTLLVSFLVMLVTLKTLAPKKPLSKWIKFVLTLSILSWVSRIIDAEINHHRIASDLTWLQKHNSHENDRWFSLETHVLNSHFVSDVLIPDKTVVYKTVPVEKATRCEEEWFGIPGDHPDSFVSSWTRFEKTGNLELDIFFPKNASKANPKVILYLHGGGWEKGHRHFISQNYHGGVPHYLLQENIIVAPSYRMSCMNLSGPEILKDVYDAARYLTENSIELFGQTRSQLNIVPWGTSAGGTLALLLAYKNSDELPISAVMNFYGVIELREEELQRFPINTYERLHTDMFISFTRHLCEKRENNQDVIEDEEQCFHEFSPIAHVTPDSVPTLTVHGKQDGLVLVNQAEKLQAVLREHNVTEATVIIQGVHDCDVLSSSFCSQAAVSVTDAFFRHLDE